MIDLLTWPEPDGIPRRRYVADGPIDFQTWIGISLECGKDNETELIDGVMVERMSAKLPHEWIFVWLLTLLRNYTSKRAMGIVLGSRTSVKIDNFNGRLPDILFVRADNAHILREDAIYGAPDLIIEIISVNDRPSDLIPLEADYRSLGVPEILFIDPQKKRVRIVRKSADGYADEIVTDGRLPLQTVQGFWIEVDWLFADDRPNELDVVLQLLNEADNGPS